MCSQMERDCRRRIERDLELADVEATLEWLKGRRVAILAERTELGGRIVKAFRSSGKPDVAVPVEAAGRSWTVSYSPWGGLRIAEVISADSPLFRQPPVADAATAIDPDDESKVRWVGDCERASVNAVAIMRAVPREPVVRDGTAAIPPDIDPVKGLGSLLYETRYGEDRPDIDAVLDPKGNLAVEIEREARRTREAIIRDGADIDPVAGLGSYLRETRYGEPRIPTIRDGKSVGALEALASIRSALRSDDPIAEAAVYAALEDDGGFPLPGYSDDETVVPDVDSDPHAVVEHQAAS